MISRISPYIYIAKLQIILKLTYRLEAFAGFGMNLIPLAAMVFMWKAAFVGGGSVAGVTEMQMISYSILAVALKDVFYFRTQDQLLEGAREGQIAIDFIRPYNLLGRYLTEDIALSATTLTRRSLPIILFSWVVIQPIIPSSWGRASLFLVSVLFSYAILWTLSALLGLLSFWLMELGNLGMVKDAIVRVLSGSIVPVWFFPDNLQTVSKYLPFQYTFQTPIGLYIGKTELAEGLIEIGVQGAWLIVLGALLWLAWHGVQRKVLIQGG
jgi:ABC-2 type transport system permease protein